MTGVNVVIDASDAVKKLEQLGVEIRPDELMNRIGIAGQAEINLSFRREGNDEGRWLPLKPATIAARRTGPNIGGGVKILQDTGRLLQSVTFNPRQDSVDVGAGTEYGFRHQEGQGVPRRPFLPSLKRATEIAVKVIENWLKELARRVRVGPDTGGG